tara:strand:+ start:6257 stop:7783 length:1527 start_codon:yes stop_codon:yes gene_type:complete
MLRGLIFFSFILFFSCNNNVSKKPNIIVFFFDDLGYGELGAYGQKIIQTKNIDKLSNSGVKFTNFYSGSPVCAPSRSIFLTGLHSGNTPIRGNHEYGSRGDVWDYHKMSQNPNLEGQYPIGENTLIFPMLLKNSGYKTAMVGKWGLGPPNSKSIPTNMGFDYFYGYNCQRMAHNLYPPHLWENSEKDTLNNKVISPKLKLPIDSDPYDELNYNIFNQNDYAPEIMHKKAINFLNQNKENPFFLFYASPLPHAPLQAPKYLIDKYKKIIGKEDPYIGNKGYFPTRYPRATYAAMIEYIDLQVGEIIEELKSLDIYDNTIIIISSDNGPTYAGGVDYEYFNSTGIFQNKKDRMKGYIYEGGIRVPMILSWPEKIKKGKVINEIFASYDLFPTICDLSNINFSEKIDGITMKPIILGLKNQNFHDYLYWEFPAYGGQQGIRFGKWKAIKKNIFKGNRNIELYDLNNDPKEIYDLSNQNLNILKKVDSLFKIEHSTSSIERFKLGYIDNDKN